MEKSFITQAVILAGGYGERLRPFTEENPKPMYPIEGKPFLEFLIEQVKGFGIKDIIILLGYKAEKIQSYFGDGRKWDINIRYTVTPPENETALRLESAYEILDEQFLLMYCDNYCPISFEKLRDDYFTHNSLIQLTAYSNRDGYTKSNLRLNDDGQVVIYDKTRKAEALSGVDIGYAIVNKAVFSYLKGDNVNFEKIVYPSVQAEGRLYATVTEHRYYSIGSWERIELTKQFFSQRKFIFLDRDGTINNRPPKACYIEKPEDFIWLEGAKEAILNLNKKGFLIFLITNQPGIARGNLTEKTLADIHDKMNRELNEIGARIEKIYICPHNWDDGCFCRKPKPGMFFQAQKEYNIDLTKCYMVGDDERDIIAGNAAGCKCILVDENHSLKQIVDEIIK